MNFRYFLLFTLAALLTSCAGDDLASDSGVVPPGHSIITLSIGTNHVQTAGRADDPNATPEEQLEFAQNLAERIRSGEISFEDAAVQWSRDEYAHEGGQWPFRKRSDLSVSFANIVFAMPKNVVSDPLVSPHGFTIVCVQEIKRATPPSLEAPGIKARVDESVRRKKSEERYREWIERLRKKAVIRIYI